MTALTHDRSTEYSLGDLLAVPVAAGEHIYGGSMVCLNAAGYAVPAADASGLVLAGVAVQGADNAGGADGDAGVIVRRRGRYHFKCQSALDQSAMGANVYVVDDQTVTADAADVTHEVAAGVVDRVEDADNCWVAVGAAVLEGRSWSAPTTTTGT